VNTHGEALVAELKWVHDMIRRDLTTVRQMAADVAAGLLDDVEAAATDLSAAESPEARQRLTQALGTLSADLLAHLRYEEDQISGTLRTWSGWRAGEAG